MVFIIRFDFLIVKPVYDGSQEIVVVFYGHKNNQNSPIYKGLKRSVFVNIE